MKTLEKKYIDKIDQHLITSLGRFEHGYVMYAETAKTFISELCAELKTLQANYEAQEIIIADLKKQIEPKTCEGCKYENLVGEMACFACSRGCEDHYEPKENND